VVEKIHFISERNSISLRIRYWYIWYRKS